LFKAIRWLLSAPGVLVASLIAAPLVEEHRGREIQTQKYRSHKSMSNSLPMA